MNGDHHINPDIVTHRIPRIDVFQVTDDELTRIEEMCTKVSHNFSFMLTSMSIGITCLLSLFAATYTEAVESWVRTVTLVCFLVAFYTGSRWYKFRKNVPTVLDTIRNRKIDPQGD